VTRLRQGSPLRPGFPLRGSYGGQKDGGQAGAASPASAKKHHAAAHPHAVAKKRLDPVPARPLVLLDAQLQEQDARLQAAGYRLRPTAAIRWSKLKISLAFVWTKRNARHEEVLQFDAEGAPDFRAPTFCPLAHRHVRILTQMEILLDAGGGTK
jgi:hypothetical protein